ncbi:hypothetical protein V8B55DRAFT_1527123 [Mucor lusitanicus]
MSSSPTATTPATEKKPDASPTTTPAAAPEEELFKVFVGNLSFSTTDESLEAFFSQAGKVLETIISKQGRRPRGYGFVGYGTAAEAEKAIANLDKKELDGREISVQLAKPREPKPAGEKKKKKRNNKKSRKAADEGTPSEGSVDPISSVETSKEVPTEPKPKTTVDGLSELFKAYQVESTLVAIKRNGGSKGYGFVELKTVDEMNKVLKEFGEVEIDGRVLHISAATSEKNTERKPKAKKAKASSAATSDGEQEPATKPKKSNRNRKSANKKKAAAAKEKEGVEAAKEAQEAVVQLKESDGVEAAHQAQDAILELKEKDGAEAAHKAQDAVKDLKKEDGAKAANKAQDAVKELKKEDGVDAAHEAQGAVKDLKNEDGAKAATAATDAVKK